VQANKMCQDGYGWVLLMRMSSLGYKRLGRKLWRKVGKVVRVVHSSEYKRYVRILLREEWKDYHAIIFDYSPHEGPVCVAPINVLFKFPFCGGEKKTGNFTRTTATGVLRGFHGIMS
jgi:hypothetical protein